MQSVKQIGYKLFPLLLHYFSASALKRMPLEPTKDCCGLLAQWIQQGLLFADLSVQLHIGIQMMLYFVVVSMYK